ncbi:hypothetical protein BSLG_009585 [Batrachochytrium salamandrivorans]|nr:hypothetical protein BSLG_009585 [Batrachochytrium salamandrivorans]
MLLFILQQADYANQRRSNPHPPLGSLQGVQRCQGRHSGGPCVSVMYTPDATVNGVSYTQIMQTFAELNQPRTGYSLKIESPITDYMCATQTVRRGQSHSVSLLFPHQSISNINFGSTLPTSNGTDIYGREVIAFVRGIDEAIITVLNDPAATIKANIDISVKDWPLIPPTILSDTIVQTLGPVFFFCSEMIIFIGVLNQIVLEKELKLRYIMEAMGLRPSVYWLSHFILYSVLVLINALYFSLPFLFGEAMVLFAFFITTLVRKTRVAILIGIFIFIIGILFESFIFSNTFIGYLWWSPESISPLWWKVLVWLPFSILAAFSWTLQR